MASQLSSDLIFRSTGTSAEFRIHDASNEPLSVIERLKDEFGDYSDPLTYDWTWIETD